MTNQKCATLCAGYGDFGLEYGREVKQFPIVQSQLCSNGPKCMCGNSNRSGGRAPEVDCRMKCPGDTTQLCGGQRRSSVFALEGTSFPLQILPHQPRGCYAEPATGRLISYAVVTDNAMTVAKCAEICIGSGLFGLEYGRECFCHSPYLVDVPETAKVADSQCSMPCAGNSSEICGGPSRLNLYEYYYE